jgi:hypothetical protein
MSPGHGERGEIVPAARSRSGVSIKRATSGHQRGGNSTGRGGKRNGNTNQLADASGKLSFLRNDVGSKI